MNKTEIDSKIKEAYLLRINPNKGISSISSTKTLSNYIENEISNWKHFETLIGNGFIQLIVGHYSKMKGLLDEINNPEENIEQKVKELIDLFYNPLSIPADSPTAQTLINRYKTDKSDIDQAFSYLNLPQNSQGLNALIKQPKNNLKSISYYQLITSSYSTSLQNNYLQQILKTLHSDYSRKLESDKINSENYKNIISSQAEEIKQLKIDKENELNALIDESKQQVEAMYKENTERIASLKTLYEEKLRLSAASKHWEKYQKSQRNLSLIWFGAALVLFIALSIFLTVVSVRMEDFIFTDSPEITFEGTKLGIEQISTSLHLDRMIKLFLIVTIVVSMGIYLLRQFVKLGMSCMHLSRDAAERRELSHQYLALLKNSDKISPKEREIILQALFSRSDTGLLKSDVGPTLPGNTISNIFSN